jgi:hypothetical protein
MTAAQPDLKLLLQPLAMRACLRLVSDIAIALTGAAIKLIPLADGGSS